ncbi:Ig-like domain-containing protein [Neobacillus cucumis]|nr:Ig-like domain-containing protein [Neobacillus cucumis]
MRRLVVFLLALQLFFLPGAVNAEDRQSNQPYNDMRLGISKSYSNSTDMDVPVLKVADPYYSGSNPANTSYAVISNESTDGDSEQPTGTINFKSMKKSMDKSAKPGMMYKIDANKPFDLKDYKGKFFSKNTKSFVKSYNIGDFKNFWVSNLNTDTDYEISARLAYSGTKANVWVNDNQISDEDAVKLGKEFDSKIYSVVTSNFGEPSDVDGDGKINILTYDIQDGFTGSGSYVGGYFWPGDLYNDSHSNRSEIFYIDTYPTMGSSEKDVTKAYETLAHEFQHMVNFNQNVMMEGSNEMNPWLNEGLSMAAEQIYAGVGLQNRIDYYNQSTSIQNGHSLLYWEDYGDILSNYALSYLFVQYVKIQANQGNRIFREILTDSKNNYQAIENVAKKYISPDMTFGKLMTDFRIALLLKEPTGLYGFKGNPFFDSLQKKIFTGSSAYLHGGGAVVTAYDQVKGWTPPTGKGQDVTYTLLDMSGAGDVDKTAPATPDVKKIADRDTNITGTAEPSATVYARAGKNEIGRTVSTPSGAFTMAIPKQKAGMIVNVYAEDAAGNVSKAAVVKVVDKTAPSFTVNAVSNKSKEVTGKTEAGATITIVIGSAKHVAAADSKGNFKKGIPLQKAGVKLAITARDTAGNVSGIKTITVLDQIAPASPTVNKISNKTRTLSGKTEAKATITVTIGKKQYTVKANAKGNFKVTIPLQKAGAKLTVAAQDAAGNISAAKKMTVVDKIPPAATKVKMVVKSNTKVVIGTAEAHSTVTIKVKNKVVGKANTNSKGKFSVKIKSQKKNTLLSVTASDKAKNVSKATTIKVK